jgi:4-amino-4-deoxy-L-arabinose transferase-like glycosyltransferase
MMLSNIGVLALCVPIYVLVFRNAGRGKYGTALFLVLAAGLILRMYAASDGCLHTWDERYHALVAKHLIAHPLTPTLFENPVLQYDFTNWTTNHIWLEKGPIPLWALSGAIRLFGTDELGIRVPSVLVSILSVYLTYLIASLLFDRHTGILAAFFHSINGLLVELPAGRVSSDHVDTFFVFFVELGIFLSVIDIIANRRWCVPLLIGITTGMAVLCKWSPALVVFPVWIAGVLLMKDVPARRLLPALILAAAGLLIVVCPYLLYLHAAFPREAAWVFRKYAFAYTETLDAHSGPFYFYLQRIGVVFGELIYVPLLLGVYELARRRAGWQVGVLTVWWMLPVLVFSFAATKRPTYLLISAPAFFILLSYYWRRIRSLNGPGAPGWAAALLLLLLAALPVRYSIDRITPFETRIRTPKWSAEVKSLKDKLGGRDKVVVFNVEHNIEAMFYSDLTIYDFVPDEAMINRVTRGGYRVIINDDGRAGNRFPLTDQVEVLRLVAAGDE